MTTAIDCIVGEHLDLWRDNLVLINGRDATQDCAVTAGPASVTVFKHIRDRWRMTFPSAGTYTLEVTSWGKTDTTTVNVVADLVGTEPNQNVLFGPGDSITVATGDGGFVKVAKDAIGSQCVLLGGEITESYAHQGHTGKQWNWFTNDAASPFRNGGAIDFANYETNVIAGAVPDFMVPALGTNDYGSIHPDDVEGWIDTYTADMETFLAAARVQWPSVTILLAMMFPGNQRDSALGWATNRWDYRTTAHRVNERLIEDFEGREGTDGIVLVPTHLRIDPFNGYPAANNVHPHQVNNGHPALGQAFRHALVARWPAS